MKLVYQSALLILAVLAALVACTPQTALEAIPPATAVEQEGSASEATAEVAEQETATSIPTAEVTDQATAAPAPTGEATAGETPAATPETEVGADLPLLPPFVEANANGIGDPLPGGEADPFADASLVLQTRLPEGPATAVAEEHLFGKMDVAVARAVAGQFGFSGPLYVQQIAPEFAPPAGEETPVVYSAFEGERIMNLSDTGVTYENRGILVDFSQKPLFSEVAPLVEAQLKAWNLLDFPYELQQSATGDLVIHRLLDGIPVEQNAYNILINQDGEIAYFDYQPLRISEAMGPYPLQTAEMAWQQLQTPDGRKEVRTQVYLPPPIDDPAWDFVNPRSWRPEAEQGQEVHLYMTPAVYESIDDGGLRLMYGDFTLEADGEELAAMATHLSDVLHVWGSIDIVDGAKFVSVAGWDVLDSIAYESLEGTIAFADGQTVLQTLDGETFILPAAPADLPEGLEVYVSIVARRETGAAYPLLDWLTIDEKIAWPEAVVVTADEQAAIESVSVDAVELVYFTLYQTIDAPDAALAQFLLPVWRFEGESDQGHKVTFWVPAAAPEYQQ